MKSKLIDSFGAEIAPYLSPLKYSFYGLFITLNIDLDVMKVLSVLMLIDTVLGVLKSYKLKIQLNFDVLMWGLTAKFLVILIPLMLAVLGKYVHKDFVWTVDLVLKILIVNEVLSILANIQSVRLAKHIRNYDLVTLVIDTLIKKILVYVKSFFINQLSKGIELKKENENESNE